MEGRGLSCKSCTRKECIIICSTVIHLHDNSLQIVLIMVRIERKIIGWHIIKFARYHSTFIVKVYAMLCIARFCMDDLSVDLIHSASIPCSFHGIIFQWLQGFYGRSVVLRVRQHMRADHMIGMDTGASRPCAIGFTGFLFAQNGKVEGLCLGFVIAHEAQRLACLNWRDGKRTVGHRPIGDTRGSNAMCAHGSSPSGWEDRIHSHKYTLEPVVRTPHMKIYFAWHFRLGTRGAVTWLISSQARYDPSTRPIIKFFHITLGAKTKGLQPYQPTAPRPVPRLVIIIITFLTSHFKSVLREP